MSQPSNNLNFVHNLLSQMTLAEKIGQMTQPEKNSVKPGDIAKYSLGSVLSGGGGNPTENNPRNWREMVLGFIEEAKQSRLKIPLIYGVDAVHGHNNMHGATIFPHNIGLGATRDVDLVRRIGRATALEVAATGVRWDFAPAVSIPYDIRWGRSFEGYSQDTALVSELAAAYIEGLRGENWNSPSSVLPSVKHFVADGATTFGSSRRISGDPNALQNDATLANAHVDAGMQALLSQGAWQLDQGNSEIDEETLRTVHLPPYQKAIEAGALNIMTSYSSWNGVKMHGHSYLVNDVLKGEMGFEGFIVTDWEGIDQIDADYYTCVVKSINAGIDMVMVPFKYERFIETLSKAVENGDVPLSRIDDAVTRILKTKHALGLFDEQEIPDLSVVGSRAHREVAREAVRKSQVLLKNEGVFPFSKTQKVLLAGSAANDLGAQCGGWTISWMGSHGQITEGTNILEAFRATVANPELIQYSEDGLSTETFDVGVVVIAEEPAAEGMGDRFELKLTQAHLDVIANARKSCKKLAVLLLSGRPYVITDHLPEWDAFVASWLPGSEGQGVADVVFGDFPFTGKLSFYWPYSQQDLKLAQESKHLFKLGDGLTTRVPVTL
ncbi:glycoside hydrolase family 3 protein [Deinococcus cellulosilyticus]|uniref:beta-glucosidase n=1 Tax=Deinococcus cellulosilyticus (strain DSM 18568 / NBRC 106333 / KACC 11606 / 5516J-15) TaxID=1223518 RepID=A0A511N2U7_DEIC1|nr:glycoside hydrolase family 3 protein [Deinococcus cellulosilyticus]GEM46741.1 beta-glucosidase [Deinococcus cellulosilyticus NBRC 106333 = KACC 11606]